MAGDYDNTNRGALFRNDRKREGDKLPEYTGSLNVNGQEYRLSAWLKDGRSGKFFSISVTAKEDKPAPKPKTSQPLDDEAPF